MAVMVRSETEMKVATRELVYTYDLTVQNVNCTEDIFKRLARVNIGSRYAF